MTWTAEGAPDHSTGQRKWGWGGSAGWGPEECILHPHPRQPRHRPTKCGPNRCHQRASWPATPGLGPERSRRVWRSHSQFFCVCGGGVEMGTQIHFPWWPPCGSSHATSPQDEKSWDSPNPGESRFPVGLQTHVREAKGNCPQETLAQQSGHVTRNSWKLRGVQSRAEKTRDSAELETVCSQTSQSPLLPPPPMNVFLPFSLF